MIVKGSYRIDRGRPVNGREINSPGIECLTNDLNASPSRLDTNVPYVGPASTDTMPLVPVVIYERNFSPILGLKVSW